MTLSSTLSDASSQIPDSANGVQHWLMLAQKYNLLTADKHRPQHPEFNTKSTVKADVITNHVKYIMIVQL